MIAADTGMIEKLEKLFSPKNDVQRKAWENLAEIGLPGKKSEAYKFTPITSLLQKGINFALTAETKVTTSAFASEGIHLVIRNGQLSLKESKLTKELKLTSRSVTEGRHDPFSLLNTALSTEEIHLQVDGDVPPIFIYHYATVPVSSPRMKVEVASGKSVEIYERSTVAEGSFTNSYISFELEKNSEANYTKIQQYGEAAFSHETVIAEQARDSRFYCNTFSFSGGMVRNNLTIDLKDENCEGHMHGLYLLDGKSHVDNNTSVDHQAPNSYSNELYKGILDEKSHGVFNGKIYVRQDAQKTNAFQSNNNILLSEDAKVNTKPQLEIWADDVKCSHGCTTGQLDEEAIFYLRSRGIGEQSARALILNAFASETLERVKNEEVKAELEKTIYQKLV